MASSDRLFEPLKVGTVRLNQRIVMAPLTRFRADDDHVPTPMMLQYYKQRSNAAGTLLVTEATVIAPQGLGYPNAPGIWKPEQITAWKHITDAVHANGSFIFMQLWAVGRIAVPMFMKNRGIPVISSSAIPLPGPLRLGALETDPAVPHALSEEEIHEFIQMYTQAAKNAMFAGFDGVEIHGAGGYLVDQFTQETVNKRTDGWGGSIDKRSRFAFEVVEAVSNAIGADRTAFRMSPYNKVNGMGLPDGETVAQYSDLATRLASLKIAYLHVIGSGRDAASLIPVEKLKFLVELWKDSPVFLNGGFQPESAKRLVNEVYPSDDIAIVFGRLFISNPDLIYRIKNNLELAAGDPTTFYLPKSERGYIDYPFFEDSQTAP